VKQQLAQLTVAVAVAAVTLTAAAQQGVTRYVRYSHQNTVSYGILEGETIRELTKAMKPGDVVEIEIEGIGVLRNRVERAKAD
jgi:2-keto-4-pentenoate hydratase/2-oxohepta-3-ene-1,7-dioic acid hydratase in catechol pathway